MTNFTVFVIIPKQASSYWSSRQMPPKPPKLSVAFKICFIFKETWASGVPSVADTWGQFKGVEIYFGSWVKRGQPCTPGSIVYDSVKAELPGHNHVVGQSCSGQGGGRAESVKGPGKFQFSSGLFPSTRLCFLL